MLAHTVVTSIDQQARLEAKLRRELGDLVLRALSCGFRGRRTLFRREAEQYSGLIPNTIGA